MPVTPLESVFSQAVDFSEISDAWLPFEPLGGTAQVRAQGEMLANLGRSNDDALTEGVLTQKSEKLDYWFGGAGQSWSIEENFIASHAMTIENSEDDAERHV